MTTFQLVLSTGTSTFALALLRQISSTFLVLWRPCGAGLQVVLLHYSTWLAAVKAITTSRPCMLVSFVTLRYKVYLEVFAVPFFPLLFSSTLSSAISPLEKFNCFTWTPLPLVQLPCRRVFWAVRDHWSVVVRLLRGPVLRWQK